MWIWPGGYLQSSAATPVAAGSPIGLFGSADESSIVVHNAEAAPDAGFVRANVDLALRLFAR